MKVLTIALLVLIVRATPSFADTCKTKEDCSDAMRCCYTKPLPAALENPKDQKGYCTYDVKSCMVVK